jgi:3D (Asp-Asp-Asp) domain-containing protein
MKKILFILLIIYGFKPYDATENKKYIIVKSSQTKTTSTNKKIKVTITMYYADTLQCDDSPLITACGYKINPKKASQHKWIAVSRDLLKKFKYGDKVRISNAGKKDGIYQVSDTMNKRYKNKVDILETKGVAIYKLTNAIIEKV